MARNNSALATLINQHGVQVKRFSEQILRGLRALSEEVLADLTSQDALSREVYASLMTFRKDAIRWSRLSEQTYLAARDRPVHTATRTQR